MDLRQLEYFVAVAEELHFGRAADRSFVAQPALSKSIKGLEEELGARLFKRTSRKVELTDEGGYLLREAREILERVGGVAEEVRRRAAGEGGALRLLFVAPASQTAFPEAIREYRRQCGGVRLELREMPTVQQFAALRAGEAHAGLVRNHGQSFDGLEHLTFSYEPYVLALPEDHPLAGQEAIGMDMFDGLPFITFPRRFHPLLHDDLERAFAEAGVRPVMVQEAISKQSALGFVAAGMGAALVPDSSHRLRRAGVVYRPLCEPEKLPWVEFTLIWRDEPNPRLARFVDVVRAHARA